MDLVEVLHVFWRRRLLIAATVALAVGIAIAFLVLANPLYQSSATLALRTDKVDAINAVRDRRCHRPDLRGRRHLPLDEGAREGEHRREAF
jgi:hypothetical protein